LHFDSGDGVKNLNDCINRLRQYIPNYKKNNLGVSQIESELLEKSVANAKKKHKHCEDWHTDNHTTVYLLVEKILIEEKKAKK
jgi:hypothetical protein